MSILLNLQFTKIIITSKIALDSERKILIFIYSLLFSSYLLI